MYQMHKEKLIKIVGTSVIEYILKIVQTEKLVFYFCKYFC